jgi:6-phospho-3-hexuloisomerase
VIAISGTGMTKLVLSATTVAKEVGTRIVAITSYKDSPLGQMADLVVPIKGRTRMGWPREEDYLARQIIGEREPLSPLGSIFENNTMVFLDGLIVELMYRMHKNENDLKMRHATIE